MLTCAHYIADTCIPVPAISSWLLFKHTHHPFPLFRNSVFDLIFSTSGQRFDLFVNTQTLSWWLTLQSHGAALPRPLIHLFPNENKKPTMPSIFGRVNVWPLSLYCHHIFAKLHSNSKESKRTILPQMEPWRWQVLLAELPPPHLTLKCVWRRIYWQFKVGQIEWIKFWWEF